MTSIEATSSDLLVTNKRSPSGETAKLIGPLPVAIVSRMAFAGTCSTEMESLEWLATKTRLPSGVTAIPWGKSPTGTVLTI